MMSWWTSFCLTDIDSKLRSNTTNMSPKSYAFDHAKSTTASHAARTAETDAAFLLPYLKPHYRILDIGCGPGTISTSLCKYVPEGHVTAIDISPQVIEEAKHKSAESPDGVPKNLTFQCVDILRGIESNSTTEHTNGTERSPTKVPSEWKHSFDVIFSSQVTLHLSDPVHAIHVAKELLKPDTGIYSTRDYDVGMMVFWPDPSGRLRQWIDLIGVVLAKKGGAPSEYGGRDVPQYVVDAGFKRKDVKVMASTATYSGEARRWFGMTHAQRLEEGQMMRQSFLQSCNVTEQDCDEMHQALLAWAENENCIGLATAVEIVAHV